MAVTAAVRCSKLRQMELRPFFTSSRDQPTVQIQRASLIADAAGNLYSTAESGGANDYGTVFEITP